MNCPICGAEVLAGSSYNGFGEERGTVAHVCQVFADSRGKALEEYERRLKAFSRLGCDGCVHVGEYACMFCARNTADYYEEA